MVRAFSSFLVIAALLAAASTAFGSTASAITRFQPFDVPSTDVIMDPTFTHDGNEMYVTHVIGKQYIIERSTRHAGVWAAPSVVSFSGRWRDLEEVLSPDGNTMVFSSNRPLTSGGATLPAFYNRRYTPGGGGNLWIVRRSNGVWGMPHRLPDAINTNTSTFSPAIAADGTLYFMRASGPRDAFNLYVSKLENGTYKSSTLAAFSDTQYQDFDPTIAPDGSFVIFSSTRPPAPHHGVDLFISFHGVSGWSIPKDLSLNANAVEARLSPDEKTLYFLSTGTRTAGTGSKARRQLWSVGMQ